MANPLDDNSVAFDAVNNQMRLARINARPLAQLQAFASSAGVLYEKIERAEQVVSIRECLFNAEGIDSIFGDCCKVVRCSSG